jgi:AcrR family transcriptional regulator
MWDGAVQLPRVLTHEAVGEFRERLVDAAERLFAQHGLEAVTMRQLSAEIGVSPMTPYRYFADKDAILAAVRARAFNRHAEALERAFASAPDPIARADAVGRAYLDFALGNPDGYRLMFDVKQPSADRYPELVAASQRSRATMTAYLKGMIDAGFAKGDPDLIGHMLWSALHGAIQLQFAGMLHAPFDVDQLSRDLCRTLWAGLNAKFEA